MSIEPSLSSVESRPPEGSRRPYAAVVPTLGRSPWLRDCLEALRADGRDRVEIVLVCQGGAAPQLPEDLVDQRFELSANLGFAGGTNLGLAACHSPWLATVNDDAIIRPGWFDRLRTALESEPTAAAAQGINLLANDDDEGPRIDGRGLSWNSAWQAVQISHGEIASPAPPKDSMPGTSEVEEVFGVSATAALFRASALAEVALRIDRPADRPDPGGRDRQDHHPPGIFDPALGSYYEDVDLACRLRSAGFTALSVSAATALHAGSTTGRTMGLTRQRWIYGNRFLVAARFLGAGLWGRLPRMIWRDVVDLGRATLSGSPGAALGIVAGWGRAARHLPAFAHRGPTAIDVAELERLRSST